MQSTVTTQDGRQLSYCVEGSTGEPAVFLHHGMPGSRDIFGSHARVARSLGLTLICHDRPGYGGSSAQPRRSVADCAADIRLLADHLGLERFGTWGFSAGGPHALACAALLADAVVGAVVLASPSPPTSGIEDDDPKTQAIRSTPESAREFFDAAREQLLQQDEAGIDAWVRSTAPDIPPDEATAFAEFRVRSVREGIGRDATGLLEDQWALSNPWGFELESVSTPIRYRHGRRDTDVSPNHGEWITGRLPAVDARTSDDTHLGLLLRDATEDLSWLARLLEVA